MSVSYGQRDTVIKLKAGTNRADVSVNENNNDVFTLHFSLSELSIANKTTQGGDFIELSGSNLIRTFDKGKPNLPVMSKLVEIPFDGKLEMKIVSYDEEYIDLNKLKITRKVIPAQPSYSKDKNPSEEPFIMDYAAYAKDNYNNDPTLSYEDLGVMRAAYIVRVEARPIQYNPKRNIIKILNDLEVEIKIVGGDQAKTNYYKAKYSDPRFSGLVSSSASKLKTMLPQENVANPTYVIITDRIFETTLQPFISWKTQLGFQVITGYTDNPQVGNTATSIKSYLQNLYEQPPAGYAAPLYVLLVGDVDRIPSFVKDIGGGFYQQMDYYYCEYTGNELPEVFYGRFSAESLSQLQVLINKTIQYESLSMPDPYYFFNSMLVAGYDDVYLNSHLIPQINYSANNYFNTTLGFTNYLYVKNTGVMDPSVLTNVQNRINQGVSFINYAGHGSPDGWSLEPDLNIDNIPDLTNNEKYGLWVANACLTGAFGPIPGYNYDQCYAEAITRAPNKGAMGYIGASNQTKWDEDYWWSVGCKAVVTNPVYDPNHLGAMDRLFHVHEEPQIDWYSTQGQILFAGNLAVEQSTSVFKQYYWEAYHLFGDPSVRMKFVPDCSLNTTITDNIDGGTTDVKTISSITATNSITNGATVHYGSLNVDMNIGFSVSPGCNFTADLYPCPVGYPALKKTILPEDISHEAKKPLVTNNGTSLYPNPSTGIVNIKINDVPYLLEITDMTGRVVYNSIINDNETTLDLSQYQKGLYVVKVVSSEKQYSYKLLLQ
jgi:hypothetical protein